MMQFVGTPDPPRFALVEEESGLFGCIVNLQQRHAYKYRYLFEASDGTLQQESIIHSIISSERHEVIVDAQK